MSVMILSEKVVNLIGHTYGKYFYVDTCEDIDKLIVKLCIANHQAYNERYPDHEHEHGQVDYFRYRPLGEYCKVAAYKACQSWLYNSDEIDNTWSQIRRLKERLASDIIEELPEYKESDWC